MNLKDSHIFLQPAAVLEVSGGDHVSFLHSILSQDILTMQNGEWREAALLSATSHVRALMTAVKTENSVLLIASANQTASIPALLDKFIITEDVRITDVSSEWKVYEIWGTHAVNEIKKINFAYAENAARGNRLRLLTKECITAENDAALREILRVENGLLEFGADVDESIRLSETRREKIAASETKGCYPGQEVVAKIETYKRLNRSFVKLEWNGEKLPEKNAAIVEKKSGEEIGRLTSRTFVPSSSKAAGLGWLKRGFYEVPVEAFFAGTDIQIKTSALG